MGEADKQGTRVTMSSNKRYRSSGAAKQSPRGRATTFKDHQSESNPSIPSMPVLNDSTRTNQPLPKASTTRPMKVSFSLVGRVQSSFSRPRRDKVVSFIQLGRLADQTPVSASLPSLRDILAKSSSCASEMGDPATTPQPRQSVAQWLRNLHTPDSIESGGGATPVLARLDRRVEGVSVEIQTSQCFGMKENNVEVTEKGYEEDDDQHLDGVVDKREDHQDQSQEGDKEDEQISGQSPLQPADLSSQKVVTISLQSELSQSQNVTKQAEANPQKIPPKSSNHQSDSVPPPALSTLLQSHLSNNSPSLSARPNARLARKKAKTGTTNPYLDPRPGPSGTQKKLTRAQSKAQESKKVTRESSRKVEQKTEELFEALPEAEEDSHDEKKVDADKDEEDSLKITISQVESSCPETIHPWVINMSEEDSSELPDIDKYSRVSKHQPFMAEILGKEVDLYSQDKETREEELDRIARLQFEEENSRREDSPIRKRERTDDSDEDSPAKMAKKKVRRLESDEEDASQEVQVPSGKKQSSTRSSVGRSPGGSAFQNTFQQVETESESSVSQVIDVLDSQEEMVTTQHGYTDQDMEMPLSEQQSKSLSIPAASLTSSSSASSLTSHLAVFWVRKYHGRGGRERKRKGRRSAPASRG
eukprot:GFUD01107620.1.p1 GENE.GFUD01107620.1~~GFUD01107620.1.p1  ORF type:complete len:673 (-),score=261.58 GFUD01107620.1:89-2026(-)